MNKEILEYGVGTLPDGEEGDFFKCRIGNLIITITRHFTTERGLS